MKRAIITGPTGVIGMALIEYLCEKNIQVIAVVRGDSKRKNQIRESENIVKIDCSLDNIGKLPKKVKLALKEKNWNVEQPIDVFYHFAWAGTSKNDRNDVYLQEQNIKYALHAVDAASELNCRIFVGAGSQAEYGRYEGVLKAETPAFPEISYGAAKLCAGQMTRIRCEQKNIKHIWTRILSVYGPYNSWDTMIMDMIHKMLLRERAACTKGGQMWDYLYAKDAAKMMYLLGEKGVHGKTYCVGSGIVKPIKEYIEIIRNTVNPQAEVGYGDIEYLPRQIMYLCADIGELIKDTEFEPEYSFEAVIRETVEWCKCNMREREQI